MLPLTLGLAVLLASVNRRSVCVTQAEASDARARSGPFCTSASIRRAHPHQSAFQNDERHEEGRPTACWSQAWPRSSNLQMIHRHVSKNYFKPLSLGAVCYTTLPWQELTDTLG